MRLVLISKEAEVDTAPMALKGEDEGRDGGGLDCGVKVASFN